MSRTVRSPWPLLAGILALALVAAPAPAQPPQGKAPGAPPAGRPARGAASGHLWWNDAEVIAKLSLTPEQRKQMDARLEEFRKQRANPARARDAFHTALRAGDTEKARSALSAWADAEAAQAHATGDLKSDVLALLNAEQRKQLQSFQPDLVGTVWSPRVAWKAPAPQKPRPARH